MAAATITVTVPNIDSTWSDSKMYHVLASLAISPSPATYTIGGLTLAFTDPLIKAQRAPKKVDFYSQSGFVYAFIPGTNNTNNKMKIFTAFGIELPDATAIPAANSSDIITCEAVFLGQN